MSIGRALCMKEIQEYAKSNANTWKLRSHYIDVLRNTWGISSNPGRDF